MIKLRRYGKESSGDRVYLSINLVLVIFDVFLT
jgi:hypothetical protein